MDPRFIYNMVINNDFTINYRIFINNHISLKNYTPIVNLIMTWIIFFHIPSFFFGKFHYDFFSLNSKFYYKKMSSDNYKIVILEPYYIYRERERE